MGQPAARLTDPHTCPMVTPGTPPVPHVGGPILPACAPTVLTGSLPQARINDMALCVGPPDMIATGSATVFVSGMPAARMGDMTVHGGVIVAGCPTVLIGDFGGGAGGGSAQPALSALGLEGGDVQLAAMTKALIAAARQGKPFCEQCTRAALAAAARGR